MNPPYIPATALGGGLLAPYLPVTMEWHADEDPPRWVSGVITAIEEARDGTRVIWYSTDPYIGFDNRSPVFLRLDPRRPEVAHRIADVLRSKGHEVGHLLPVSLGGRQGDATVEERMAQDEGGGTLRGRVPAADVSAVLLAASVAGVEAGRGVVRGVLGEWREDHWTHYRDGLDGHQRVWTYIRAGDRAHDGDGWAIGRPTKATPKGPETGPEGRAAADAALLRLGYAYLDPAAPFGIVVPFLRDGREVGS